ncbi:MAG: SagB/ThcOx family dehydrogenase [Planctomycetales bacterium]|nr:SagB/ThcOx family dehydrogenase [Planctomycetales bacterium]
MRKRETDRGKKLPAAQQKSGAPLADVLARRRSLREFTDQPLTDAQLSQLLWATQGLSHSEGYRTAPSAGGLYPLELYVAMADGLYRYLPEDHRLSVQLAEDIRPALRQAALDQEPVGTAPAVFILTGVYQRTAGKYGQTRAVRYVHMEAGHAGQNLLLQATALNLGAVPIGAFEDRRLSKILRLPRDEVPLYLIPVGHPR